MRKELKRLIELDREHTLVAHIDALLGWDQETYLPEKGVAERADQLAFVEGLAHEKAVNPEIGDLLAALESRRADLDPVEAAYLRLMRREYDKETKLPAELVTEMAKQVSLAQSAWAKARKTNDFPLFAPHLEIILRLNKEKAACLNPSSRPYDVLLDLYEFGSTEASIAKVFSVVRGNLVLLLDKIRSRPQVDDSFLHRKVDAAAQARISDYLMSAVGFERERGRLDTTAHPFTTTLGKDDVRITTRYIEDFFPSSMFSTIHESGHALYEMGIEPRLEFQGTRLAEAVSMAVHESQSRMWENIIGRSVHFWKKHYTPVQKLTNGALDGVSLDAFVKAVNKVEPSLIRTEADEVTYGLHVIARFELESAMIGGTLSVKDVPAAWNAKIKELLGLEVPNDAVGCLQDIHWSMGSFGYFPSYALGNLYAAQFWAQMKKDIPDLDQKIESGDNTAPLVWLRKNIHGAGSRYLPGELVEKVTGSSLDPAYFAAYLGKKYGEVYGF